MVIIHIHIHTYTHTHIYIYIYTYMYIYICTCERIIFTLKPPTLNPLRRSTSGTSLFCPGLYSNRGSLQNEWLCGLGFKQACTSLCKKGMQIETNRHTHTHGHSDALAYVFSITLLFRLCVYANTLDVRLLGKCGSPTYSSTLHDFGRLQGHTYVCPVALCGTQGFMLMN